MKILHTSDWHIGRALHTHKRYKEYEAFLNWLAGLIEDQDIDVLLVAGDIFDNSTPTNEPVVDGRLLHEIDPAFKRFTSFNIPGPNYHQGESRFTVNYNRQLTDWARIVETFGYRAVQLKFIDDGDFIGTPYSLAKQTVTMYPFSQQADEDIY